MQKITVRRVVALFFMSKAPTCSSAVSGILLLDNIASMDGMLPVDMRLFAILRFGKAFKFRSFLLLGSLGIGGRLCFPGSVAAAAAGV